jgi:Cu2+-exporting ATPase
MEGMVQHMFGFSAPTFPGSEYVPALFGTAVYFYGGLVLVKGGLQELRDRKPGMMTPIFLAITAAFVFSLPVTLGYPGEALWWELVSLGTIMLLGHSIEMRSISQASGALRELVRLLPSTAQRTRRRDHRRCGDLGAPGGGPRPGCDRAAAFRPTASCRAARAT